MPAPSFVLFPSHPLRPGRVDPDFEPERDAAVEAGFSAALVHIEALQAGDVGKALSACKAPPGEALVYRGWMLTLPQQRALFDGLVARDLAPLVDPDAYAEAHHLPRAYPHLVGETARSVFSAGPDIEQALGLLPLLPPGPVFVKDYVKSAKHRFREACVIEDPSDRASAAAVLGALLEARGDRFEGGFVLRELLRLASSGEGLRGEPLHDERRLFFVRGRPLFAAAHLDLDLERFGRVARRFSSPFVSVDVARLEAGGFVIVEVGDGGVSGLPATLDPGAFYAALREGLSLSE